MKVKKQPICGVYFLLRREKIQYIGQSVNVVRRISAHRLQKNIEFDTYRVIECQAEKRLEYESRWIRLFKPPHNHIVGGKRPGAGRPNKEPTVTIRVPVSKLSEIKNILSKDENNS